MTENQKLNQYIVKLTSQMQDIFNEDCDNYINPNELLEDNNATDFIHAMANAVPTLMYQKLTNEDVSMLDFNHIANRLVFQNSKLEDED